MPEVAVETLGGMPSTAPLLVRAALTAKLPRGDTVPDRTLVVEDVRVDRARLAAYQRLTGYDVGDTLPQPYPWVLAFPVQTALMARRDFPVPLPGLVHLANRVTTHRRLDAGDPLTLSVTAGALRPHRRGRTLDVRLEARVGDELVWECDSVYLSRGRGTDGRPARRRPARRCPRAPAVARWRLPEDLGRSYAGVSGDVNPIHLYPLTAKGMGFPRQIAHGMWTYARTLASLGRTSLGPSTSRVWFTRPVFLPSTVELVVGHDDATVVAGLRSAKDPAKGHLVLTLGAGIRRPVRSSDTPHIATGLDTPPHSRFGLWEPLPSAPYRCAGLRATAPGDLPRPHLPDGDLACVRTSALTTSTTAVAGPRRRVVTVGLAVLALVAATGSAGASADTTAPPSYISSWLALSTGATNTVALVTPAGTTTRTQTLGGGSNCAMTQGDQGLLAFSGTGSLGPGLNTGSIGVREKKNASGTSCSAVRRRERREPDPDAGERGQRRSSPPRPRSTSTSSRAPRSWPPPSAAPPRSAATSCAAALDHRRRHRCRAAPSRPRTSGSATTRPTRARTAAPTTTAAGRSAPPRGPGSPRTASCFDSLTLTAVMGSFSLEGGADGFVDDPAYPMPAYFGADQDASILELVEGVDRLRRHRHPARRRSASSWKRLGNFGRRGVPPFPYSSRTGTDAGGASPSSPSRSTSRPGPRPCGRRPSWSVAAGTPCPPIRIELDVVRQHHEARCSTRCSPAPPRTSMPAGPSSGRLTEPTGSHRLPDLGSAWHGQARASRSPTRVYVYGDAKMQW